MSSKNNWERDMQKGMLEPVRISGGDVKAFKALVLVLLGIAAVGGILTKSYVAGIICLSLFVIVLLVFGTKNVHDNKYRRDHDMVHGGKITVVVYVEKKHAYGTRDQGSIFREIKTNTNPDSIWIPFEEYLTSKIENQNVEIFGRMGTGKTTLGLRLLAVSDPAYQKIVFGYKRKDSGKYQKLGYEHWNMQEHRADPWSNKDAFIRALVAAIDLDSSSGITANSVEDLVTDVIRNSNSWDELFVEIKVNINKALKEKDIVTKLALSRIERALKVIYDPNAKYFTIPRHNIFLDYAQVKNRTVSTFDSEFLLELLYDEIIEEKRNNVLTYIDEAHRLLRNRYERGNNVSVIEDLISKEIRATGSRLVLCTQSYQDVSPTARDQPATQFIFRTQQPETLAELKEVSELLPPALADLDTFNFVDVGQDYQGYKVRDRVIHFRLYPKTLEESVPESIANSEPATDLIQAPTIPSQLEASQTPQQIALPSPSYLMRIIEMLEEQPLITQEIATRLVMEDQKPKDAPIDWMPSNEQVGAMKRDLIKPCVQLLWIDDTEFADVLLLQDEYRDKPKSLYFLKGKGEKGVHTRLTTITKNILLEHYDASKITDGRDRDDVPDFEIPGYAIEVESGLRRGNMNDLEDRIIEVLKDLSKSVIIVVPNDATRERYKKQIAKSKTLSERAKERVTILVLYELGYHLNSLPKRPLTSVERTSTQW